MSRDFGLSKASSYIRDRLSDDQTAKFLLKAKVSSNEGVNSLSKSSGPKNSYINEPSPDLNGKNKLLRRSTRLSSFLFAPKNPESGENTETQNLNKLFSLKKGQNEVSKISEYQSKNMFDNFDRQITPKFDGKSLSKIYKDLNGWSKISSVKPLSRAPSNNMPSANALNIRDQVKSFVDLFKQKMSESDPLFEEPFPKMNEQASSIL